MDSPLSGRHQLLTPCLDLYDVIEWISKQSWCNGRVGMTGISYLGMVGWTAAQQKPPSLKAIIPWEAANDFYSQRIRPGGIANTRFHTHWWNNAVLPYQHGRREGIPEEILKTQRVDYLKLITEAEYRGDGPWVYFDRHRAAEKVEIPFYSAGNWMDTELHCPGNILGYMRASSKHKFLEMHVGTHIAAYYGRDLIEKQRQFLDYFLFDKHDNGLTEAPRVDLIIRKGTEQFRREEKDFPPPDTEYREYLFTPEGGLIDKASGTAWDESQLVCEYPALTGKAQFQTEPLTREFELLGFPYLVVEVSTNAKDLDLFITIMNIGPDGESLQFVGNHDETTDAVTRGYFRLSHRELDHKYSTEHLPVLSQKRPAAVESGKRYTTKVPVRPTSMIFERGHRIRIELSAKDSDGLMPIMQHGGWERTEDRFGGYNRFFIGSRLILPCVIR